MTHVHDVTIHALASGSSGNAMLVLGGGTALVIDAGLGVRNLAAMIARRGVVDGKLDGILLTHEHTDHSVGAGPLARRTGAPIIGNRATLEAYSVRDELGFTHRELPTACEMTIGAFSIRSFPIPHDATEPVGYVLECGATRIAYFTDAGSPTPEIRQALKGAHLAVIEANHDLEWLWRGPYTHDMKTRVASETGHLSNDDCADLIAERLEDGGPLSIWLAHLSRVNNSAALARRHIHRRVGLRTRVPFHLDVALRDQPSISWRSGSRAVQLSLL